MKLADEDSERGLQLVPESQGMDVPSAQLGYEALTQLFFLVLAQFWSFSEIPLEASCSSGMCQM